MKFVMIMMLVWGARAGGTETLHEYETMVECKRAIEVAKDSLEDNYPVDWIKFVCIQVKQ